MDRENEHSNHTEQPHSTSAETAVKAKELLEQTSALKIEASRALTDQGPKIQERARLVEKLIGERETLGPKIKELVEQAGVLQREKGLPGVDEYKRDQSLTATLDTIYELEENAKQLEGSIDALAANPDIKAVLDARTEKDDAWNQANNIEKEIPEVFGEQMQAIANGVCDLHKRTTEEDNRLRETENQLWDARRGVNVAIRDHIHGNKHVGDVKKELWLQSTDRHVKDSSAETSNQYTQRMAQFKQDHRGFRNRKIRSVVDEILSLPQLETLQQAETAHAGIQKTDWGPERETLIQAYRSLFAEAAEKYGEILKKADRLSSITFDLHYQIGSKVDELKVYGASELHYELLGLATKDEQEPQEK